MKLELERELNEMQAPDIAPLLAHGIRVHPLALILLIQKRFPFHF